MSNGLGLFAGALSRAVSESIGGLLEGELRGPEVARRIRRGQMEEELFPYQMGAARAEAEDRPGRLEHERWRRGQERVEAGRPKVSISGEHAARVTPEGQVTWERRPLTGLETQIEQYQTEELTRQAKLPGELRTALQAAETRKGSPLTLEEQTHLAYGLAPDFKTKTDYLKLLAGLQVARERRQAAEQRAQMEEKRLGAWTQYWQSRAWGETQPRTRTIETPAKPVDPTALGAYQQMVGSAISAVEGKYPRLIPSSPRFGQLVKQEFLRLSGLPPGADVDLAWQPPSGFGPWKKPGRWTLVGLRLPPTRRVERTYRGGEPEGERTLRPRDFEIPEEPRVESAEEFLELTDLQ